MADRHESKFIENIVKGISEKLELRCLNVVEYPIGLKSRVKIVKRLLSLELDNICMVGIWGIGGIGKTTIAKAVYNQICNKFEGISFLANVREISKENNGLVCLQKHLLYDIIKDKNQYIRSVDQGIEVIKQRAWSRKVLVVLDDVDNDDQLKALGVRRDWLHPGSRIIITTRDKSLLELLEVDKKYRPRLLNENKSLELFSRHAFRPNHPIENYKELSREVVRYARGLPLALKVLGSSLFQKTMPEWESTLRKLKVIPHKAVQEKLKISFDSLEDEEKDVFLDIACFFVGMNKKFSIDILEGCGCFSENTIGILLRRCLVVIDNSNRLMMHDLIRDMGRDIVRKEHPKEPGKRSRLWFHEDGVGVLTNHTGTEVIEGIILDLPSSNALQVNAQTFTKMNSLRLLKLHNVHLSTSNKLCLSKELRWLYWFGYPLKSIPCSLSLEKVVVIDLRFSSLKQVWEGKKILSQLKLLNLSDSYYLTKTPDFSGCTNLEKLLLNDCTSLEEVHQSIECLDKLVVLGMKNCKNLTKLPSEMKSVEILDLSGCSKLGMFLGFQRSASKSWFSRFLTRASLFGNPDPISLRSGPIKGLISIRELNLANSNLSFITEELGSLMSLESLKLSGNTFCTLPASIRHLSRLTCLNISHCTRLQSLPELPTNVSSVRGYACRSLERISLGLDFRKLPYLYFSNCYKLDANNFGILATLGEFKIAFGASEVPECIKYRSVGSVLSLVVPDQKILGWTLYLVLRGCSIERRHNRLRPPIPGSLKYKAENKSRGVEYFNTLEAWYPPLKISQHTELLIHHAPKHNRKLEMEVGDEVKFSVPDDPCCCVKQCGINLIYE